MPDKPSPIFHRNGQTDLGELSLSDTSVLAPSVLPPSLSRPLHQHRWPDVVESTIFQAQVGVEVGVDYLLPTSSDGDEVRERDPTLKIQKAKKVDGLKEGEMGNLASTGQVCQVFSFEYM